MRIDDEVCESKTKGFRAKREFFRSAVRFLPATSDKKSDLTDKISHQIRCYVI